MSGSAMAEALETMLGAASVLGAAGVSRNDYGILEGTSASAAVIRPAGFETAWRTFGGNKSRTWTFRIEGYVRDTGDPQMVLDRILELGDAIPACLDTDGTLQGTAQTMLVTRGTHPRDTFVETGGAVWLPFDFLVEAEEWI